MSQRTCTIVVVAVYKDVEGKRYRSMGDWKVNVRQGDVIIGTRFNTEAEALEYARSLGWSK